MTTTKQAPITRISARHLKSREAPEANGFPRIQHTHIHKDVNNIMKHFRPSLSQTDSLSITIICIPPDMIVGWICSALSAATCFCDIDCLNYKYCVTLGYTCVVTTYMMPELLPKKNI